MRRPFVVVRRRTRRPVLVAIASVALVAGCRSSPVEWYHAANRARALGERSTVSLHPCLIRSLLGPLTLCGSYDVWENRAAQSGRRLRLHLVVMPASGVAPDSDAVVLLDGGPGLGAATDAGIAGLVRGSWGAHDIVLIDQRGTGQSAPLTCSLYDSGRAAAYLGPRLPAAEVETCRSTLARNADLTQYTTSIAVGDLAEVLSALGMTRIDLVGASYGGRVALDFMRRFPDRLRSATLLSSPGPDVLIPLPFAEAANRALEAAFDDCQHDATCGRAFPTPRVELDSVFARLDRAPVAVTLGAEHATWTRDAFANVLQELLYDVAHARKVPYWIHQAYVGRYDDFARETVRAHRGRWRNAYGETLSVICSEDVPFMDSAAVAAAEAARPLGSPLLQWVRTACRRWPRAPIPPDFHAPVMSAVPTLVIAGARDPTGATQSSEAVARSLALGRLVVTPRYAHAEVDRCVEGIMTAFIARPDPRMLDTTCVDTPYLPPFAITDPR